MSALSDFDIKREHESGRLGIEPFDPDRVQPASYDLTLAENFLRFKHTNYEPFDPREDEAEMQMVVCEPGEPFILEPGVFVLGATVESVRIPRTLIARLEGKSSLGRLGLLVHSTAGFIDPGFSGTITLEFFCLMPRPIMLWPGMKVAQISFLSLQSEAKRLYGSEGLGSKYQGQQLPEASRYHENRD